MRLVILLPTDKVVDEEVIHVSAEGLEGRFTLLPRHVDYLSALTPGVLSFIPEAAEAAEQFVAVDEGVLVKCGDTVRVSVRHAARGGELGQLESIVREQFRVANEREEKARSASARLEAGFARKFLEWRKTYD